MHIKNIKKSLMYQEFTYGSQLKAEMKTVLVVTTIPSIISDRPCCAAPAKAPCWQLDLSSAVTTLAMGGCPPRGAQYPCAKGLPTSQPWAPTADQQLPRIRSPNVSVLSVALSLCEVVHILLVPQQTC